MAADLSHRPSAGLQWAQEHNGYAVEVTPNGPLGREETLKKASAVSNVIGKVFVGGVGQVGVIEGISTRETGINPWKL